MPINTGHTAPQCVNSTGAAIISKILCTAFGTFSLTFVGRIWLQVQAFCNKMIYSIIIMCHLNWFAK